MHTLPVKSVFPAFAIQLLSINCGAVKFYSKMKTTMEMLKIESAVVGSISVCCMYNSEAHKRNENSIERFLLYSFFPFLVWFCFRSVGVHFEELWTV
jgi:hypothetical protein